MPMNQGEYNEGLSMIGSVYRKDLSVITPSIIAPTLVSS